MKHDREELDPPQPPQPPPFRRELRLGWLQVVGVGLLLLLPLAALTGALGTAEREASARAGDLSLDARYPYRTRYMTPNSIELRLKNHGDKPLAGVTLRLAEDYLAHFGDLSFRPAAERLTEGSAEIELGELPPGETRRVVVEFRAEGYGRQAGRVSAATAGGAPVELELATLILP